MALISVENGYLYILAPRTGCTAIAAALGRTAGAEWVPPADIVGADGEIIVQRKHSTLTDLLSHDLLDRALADRLFTFTSVRNPFDSLVSYYIKQRESYRPLLDDPDSFVNRVPGFRAQMLVAIESSFPDWLEHQYGDLRGQEPRHLYGSFIDGVDHVMRYERFQHDLDQVMDKLGLARVEVPLLNPTREREVDHRTYYDDRSRRLVEQVFGADIDRFGYRFDDAPPTVAAIPFDEADRPPLVVSGWPAQTLAVVSATLAAGGVWMGSGASVDKRGRARLLTPALRRIDDLRRHTDDAGAEVPPDLIERYKGRTRTYLRGVTYGEPWGFAHPLALRILPVLTQIESGLRFVHVVSDGRSIVGRRPRVRRGVAQEFLATDEREAASPWLRAALTWARIHERAASAGEELGDRYQVVRVEDLEDPQTATALVAWARDGTAYDPPRPPRPEPRRWRRLPEESRREAFAVIEPMLRRFGYVA